MRGLRHKTKSGKTISSIFWWCVRIAIIVAIILGVRWAIVTPKAREINFASDTLPKQYIGFKIAHVTCIHNTNNSTLVNKIKDFKPDIIIVSGGIADENGNVSTGLKVMDKLNGIASTFYVLQDCDRAVADQIKSGTSATCIEGTVQSISGGSMTVDKYIADAVDTQADSEEKDAYKEYIIDKFDADAGKTLSLVGLGQYENSEKAKYALYDLEEEAVGTFSMLVAPQIQYFSNLSETSMELTFMGGNHGNALGGKGSFATGAFASNGTTLFLPVGFEDTKDMQKPFWRTPDCQLITLSDKVYGQDNFFDRITRKLMPNTGTIFDNDGGFSSHEYRYSYGQYEKPDEVN